MIDSILPKNPVQVFIHALLLTTGVVISCLTAGQDIYPGEDVTQEPPANELSEEALFEKEPVEKTPLEEELPEEELPEELPTKKLPEQQPEPNQPKESLDSAADQTPLDIQQDDTQIAAKSEIVGSEAEDMSSGTENTADVIIESDPDTSTETPSKMASKQTESSNIQPEENLPEVKQPEETLVTENQSLEVLHEEPAATNPTPKKHKVLAPNVELKAVAPVLLPSQSLPGNVFDPNYNDISCPVPTPPQQIETITTEQNEGFVILGAEVMPGTSTRLAWSPGVSISGLEVPTPVLVVHGEKPGPALCLTAAIHGDEINGIEIVRRVIYDVDPEKLSGKIIALPVVNLQGFQRGSRYLPDRRDLNRYFPGSPTGSLASRVAYSLFSEVIIHCNMLIDFHTGSLRRANLPQIRANMKNPAVARLTEGFDDMVVVHSVGGTGMLRNAATARGIPAVTFEVGESLRLQASQVELGVKSVFSLLNREEMYPRAFSWGDGEPVYFKSIWLRANQGGILLNQVKLGGRVEKGDILGAVTDPITNERADIVSPVRGKVIGMAVNQVVMDGYAAYHIGIEATEQDIIKTAQQQEPEIETEYINEEMEPEDE